VQNIGLILGLVDTAEKPPDRDLDGRGLHPGVVPGGDRIEAQLGGPRQEAVELEMAIAGHTGVGGAPGGVIGDVGVDDLAVELATEVEDVVGDPELFGDPAGVVDVGHRTAPRVRRPRPQLHRGADDVVAGRAEQGGGDGRIDAAGHGHQDSHSHRPRNRSTATGMAARAASTSASVVVGPSVRRRLPSAVTSSRPMARRT
jgi:hypothetical protein